MAKKFKHTDFNKLIKEFKSKNKIKRKLENENQINTSNDIKNAIVLMKNLIKNKNMAKITKKQSQKNIMKNKETKKIFLIKSKN